jgi:hypothetical protein
MQLEPKLGSRQNANGQKFAPEMGKIQIISSWTRSTVASGSAYIFLSIPVMLFIISLFIPPGINGDSAAGFFVFRSMLDGGPLNHFTEPDPSNIAKVIHHHALT